MNVRARRRRSVETLLLAALATLLAALIQWTPPFAASEARLFDWLSTLAPPAPGTPSRLGDVVIVAIDEPSFSDLGLQWPWPRSLHAELVEALRKAGAKAIGFDLVFAEPSRDWEDRTFAAALGPDVVLASDESLIEMPQLTQLVRTEPLPLLLEKGPRVGLASLPLDSDSVLRRLPPAGDALAREVLRIADPAAAARFEGRTDAYLQAFGPSRTYPTVSYYQALDPDAFLPPDTFRGRIVLVGRSLQTSVEAGVGSPDTFSTSSTLRSGTLVPGVEVHASVIDALRAGRAILWLPQGWQIAVLLAAAGLATLIAWRPADYRTALGAAALVVLFVLASLALLKGANLYLQPLGPALATLLVAGSLGTRDLVEERRRRKGIVRAFSHYLAPAAVERLVRDPDALKLGGEKRELSVLFCDVRNFTPLAESMKDEPERLTQLINRLLNPLSEAVFAHDGTIDKFIGDCVMAFWNAPLDDPDHAVHAVRAGLAMLEAVEGVNAALAEEFAGSGRPAPHLAVGVGINTGACVVGNFGSDRRFDYSVLGDAVNYASRLEGASKTCRVPLLLGAATAMAVAGRLTPLLVDRIAVKGRSEREPVYTVLAGEPVAEEDEQAFHAAVETILAGGTPRPVFGDARLPPLLATVAAREADVQSLLRTAS